jgi:hypothetical protein
MGRVKWAELHRWSLVEVEFGTPKRFVSEDIDCEEAILSYPYGINMDNEFSYRHMAIVLSKNIKSSQIIVIPLTEAKPGDENNPHKVFLQHHRHKIMNLYKDTTILADHPITIDKKARIKRIILNYIPKHIRSQIIEAMKKSFTEE